MYSFKVDTNGYIGLHIYQSGAVRAVSGNLTTWKPFSFICWGDEVLKWQDGWVSRGKRNKCRLRKENQVNHNIFEPVPLIDYLIDFVTRELFDISLKMVEYTTNCSIFKCRRWVTVVCDITTKINTKPQKTNKQINSHSVTQGETVIQIQQREHLTPLDTLYRWSRD